MKKILITIGIIIVVIIIAMVVYGSLFSQKVIKSYTINEKTKDKKLLIATQGSSFKDNVIKKLAEYYTGKPIYVKVMDASELDSEKDMNYYKIVIITALQVSKLISPVNNFINSINDKNKIILVITSTLGTNIFAKGNISFDVVTSASKKTTEEDLAKKIIEKVGI